MSNVYPRPLTRTLHTPFDEVPNEILLEIFKAFSGMLSLESYDPNPGSLAALPLCAVSRRWREVALAVPKLWSYVRITTMSDVEWMKFARTRSRNYPITLSVEISDEVACTAILPELEDSRALICDLNIDLAEDDEDTAWEAGSALAKHTARFLNTGAGMPSLVALTVSIPDWPTWEATEARLVLDPLQFPLLRVLFSNRVLLSWLPGSFTGLRELHLIDCRGKKRRRLSKFLDALESASELEDVSLDDALPFYHITSTRRIRKLNRSIVLPRLRHLIIQDYEEAVLALLQHVRLPVGVEAHFTVRILDPWDDQLSGVLPRFIPDSPANVPFLETTTSASLNFLPVTHDSIYIKCMTAGTGFFGINISFQCRRRNTSPSMRRTPCVLEDFRTLFRRSLLQRLHIECDFIQIPRDLWVEVFRTFPSLCELHFSGEGYPGRLLAALTTRPEEGGTSEPPPPPKLPKLTTFILDNFPWHRDLFREVVRTFEARAMAGASRMREVRVALHGRQKNSYLDNMLRRDLGILRKYCDVVLYKDVK